MLSSHAVCPHCCSRVCLLGEFATERSSMQPPCRCVPGTGFLPSWQNHSHSQLNRQGARGKLARKGDEVGRILFYRRLFVRAACVQNKYPGKFKHEAVHLQSAHKLRWIVLSSFMVIKTLCGSSFALKAPSLCRFIWTLLACGQLCFR